MSETVHKGLAGVITDETKISKVMPEINSLTYRGYPVQDLAEHCRFEEVAYLMWHGELPNKEELHDFEKHERSLRHVDPKVIDVMRQFPDHAHPMDRLRTAVSYLALSDDGIDLQDLEKGYERSVDLLAKIPTIVAADMRLRRGEDPIAPDASLGFAENFFHMSFGKVPEPEIIRCFDISLTLYAEHSFNASTFTARTIASSLSDLQSAVVGAIGSLKGPLHGGANEAVMHTLLDIGEPEKAEDWLRDKMAKKELVMGFGHRVYRNGDSRVPTMTQAFHKVAEILDGQKWVEISDILSKIMVGEKGIHPNLDFPTGPAYYLMGFDIATFTPIFVMSRITGWTAHILEQWEDNKLIRPLSFYNGEDKRKVVPLDQRDKAA